MSPNRKHRQHWHPQEDVHTSAVAVMLTTAKVRYRTCHCVGDGEHCWLGLRSSSALHCWGMEDGAGVRDTDVKTAPRAELTNTLPCCSSSLRHSFRAMETACTWAPTCCVHVQPAVPMRATQDTHSSQILAIAGQLFHEWPNTCDSHYPSGLWRKSQQEGEGEGKGERDGEGERWGWGWEGSKLRIQRLQALGAAHSVPACSWRTRDPTWTGG